MARNYSASCESVVVYCQRLLQIILHSTEVPNGVVLSGGVKKRDLFAKPIGTYSRRPPESATPLGTGLSDLQHT